MVCLKITPLNRNWYVALLGATVLKILRAWVFTSATSGSEPDSTTIGSWISYFISFKPWFSDL